jgi:large subunit ribosomal protein L15
MNLNNLIKTNKKKIRPGRGIGSGKGKTSGRGHKGQKSRRGVAIKSFEGGQMPLFRRLPKRGFNAIKNNELTAEVNLSFLQTLADNKKIDTKNSIDLESLKKSKLISKKYTKLKILGGGELKSKFNIVSDFVSKSAQQKIEKSGSILKLITKSS